TFSLPWGIGFGISASLFYSLLILGILFWSSGIWRIWRSSRWGIFFESVDAPEPDWWKLPEIQKFCGRRYRRFLSLTVVARWFDLGLVLLYFTFVTTTLFYFFRPR